MIIVSTTLSGNTEKIIGDALLSIERFVQACILIDTGITDSTIAVAREAVGDKLVLRTWPWRMDFGAARNFALSAAHEYGADWAITIDPDERMLFKPEFDMQKLASEPLTTVVYTRHVDESYMKERMIRMNSGVYWVGTTHECVNEIPDEQRALTTNMSFTELVKPPDQLLQKALRDIELLRKFAPTDPDNPRWPYYIGVSLQNIHRYEEAIEDLKHSIKLCGYVGEGSMAAKKIVQCYGKLNRWGEAIAFCDEALKENPDATFLHFLLQISQHGFHRMNAEEKP